MADAAAPPPPDAAAAADATASAMEERQLEERIAALHLRREELDRQHKAALAAAASPEMIASAEAARAALRDANEKHHAAARELADAERGRQEVLPAYEKAQQQHELKERAEALRREIAEEEEALRRLDEDNAALDEELIAVSIACKDEREQRAAFEAGLGDLVEKLRVAVTATLAATGAIDAELDPAATLDAAASLVRTRDQLRVNTVKVVREMEAACEMKRETATRLEAEAEAALAAFREHADEGLRELVFALQDQRNALHADLGEIITVNDDQAKNLRLGHVQVTKDAAVFRPRGTSPTGGRLAVAGRPSAFRKPQAPTPEATMIAGKNKELTMEITSMKISLAKATAERTERAKTHKRLDAQVKRDADNYEIALQKLEGQIATEQFDMQRIEKENSRLAESVEHLSAMLKNAQRNIELVRGKTLPLPLE